MSKVHCEPLSLSNCAPIRRPVRRFTGPWYSRCSFLVQADGLRAVFSGTPRQGNPPLAIRRTHHPKLISGNWPSGLSGWHGSTKTLSRQGGKQPRPARADAASRPGGRSATVTLEDLAAVLSAATAEQFFAATTAYLANTLGGGVCLRRRAGTGRSFGSHPEPHRRSAGGRQSPL